jgi:hypothetical protein
MAPVPPHAVVPAGATLPVAWSQAAVVESFAYKCLMQFSTPKDINVTVKSTLYPGSLVYQNASWER